MAAANGSLASVFASQRPVEYARPDVSGFLREREGDVRSELAAREEESGAKAALAAGEAFARDKARSGRTVFVGNLPIECFESKALKKDLVDRFAAHGHVDSVRFRSLGAKMRRTKKVPEDARHISINAYIVMASAEEAQRCLRENAGVFHGRHLRVDMCDADPEVQSKKSIFVGNLPLQVDEESLWRIFDTCGEVTSIRVVRDNKTNIGKGFGYVTFKDKTSVLLALQLEGTSCDGRPIRVTKCAKPELKRRHLDAKSKKPRITRRSAAFRTSNPGAGRSDGAAASEATRSRGDTGLRNKGSSSIEKKRPAKSGGGGRRAAGGRRQESSGGK